MTAREKSAATAAPVRVAVVGAGHVGATFAYSLLLSGLAAEVVLIDVDAKRAEGEAMDLAHAVPFSRPARVWAGPLSDCAGAALTVITAGAGQKPGETRLQLAGRNAKVVRGVAPEIARHNPDGLILVATNPVDVLAQLAQEGSGLPAGRVLGSGTILDTARFRWLLGQHVGVDPRSVHAYVVGEHGDSGVPVWSSASVGGVPVAEFAEQAGKPVDQAARERIAKETRQAAYDIIQRKGATYYAIASGLVRLVEAVVRDQRTVLSVSTLVERRHGYPEADGVYLSVPCVVDRSGVSGVLRLGLDDAERAALAKSADVLREVRAGVERGG
ncbi:MAG: L-lactate dehydrogenase [Gemmatimonadaceae bacterium]